MGTSLIAFKSRTYRELYEGLEEIFDSEPFRTSFTFVETPDWIETEVFVDGRGNEVKVYFHKWNNGIYDSDFTFNGSNYKNSDSPYSMKEFSELLNTIAAVFSQFLKEYKPEGVVVVGADDIIKVSGKPQTKGQKDRIYDAFLSRVRDVDSRYYVGRDRRTGSLELIRK